MGHETDAVNGSSRELRQAAENQGLVAIYADPSSAEEAARCVERGGVKADDLQVVQDLESFAPKALTPTEPQPTRNTLIGYGLMAGAVLGLAVALTFYAEYPASAASAMFAVVVGTLIGVLYGATIAGLCMPPYRDDTVYALKQHLGRGHALLVAVGDKTRLRRLRRVIRETKPLRVLASK